MKTQIKIALAAAAMTVALAGCASGGGYYGGQPQQCRGGRRAAHADGCPGSVAATGVLSGARPAIASLSWNTAIA